MLSGYVVASDARLGTCELGAVRILLLAELHGSVLLSVLCTLHATRASIVRLSCFFSTFSTVRPFGERHLPSRYPVNAVFLVFVFSVREPLHTSHFTRHRDIGQISRCRIT